MPHSRFYIDSAFTENSEVYLEGEEAHHLQRVMRKREGEVVELVNGRNQLALAKIAQCSKKGVSLTLIRVSEQAPPAFTVILCQAIPRMNRLDLIVEKGTELGMHELWLFPAALSEKKELSPTQLKRLELISIAAMKQCGRLDLPKISLKAPLLKWKELPFPAYFGETSESAPPFFSTLQKKEGILFFIGPEAGFTSDEEKHLKSLHAQGVSLHSNILRTDTAPLIALSIITALDYLA